jgi:uncharacterized membrane protein HdeD (DUF308 family)
MADAPGTAVAETAAPEPSTAQPEGEMSRDDVRGTRSTGRFQPVRRYWWLPLLTGVLSIAAGLAILGAKWTVDNLAVFAAIIFIFRGFSLIVNPTYGNRFAPPHVIAGIFGTLTGLWLLLWPGPTLLVLGIFIGAWVAISGAFNAIVAIQRRHDLEGWGLVLALGLVELFLGTWAMRRPGFSLVLAVTVTGLWLIMTGVVYCMLAFELRRAEAVVIRLAESTRAESVST